MAENREIVTHPANPEHPANLSLKFVQGLIQIGNNVVGILDSA